MTDTSPVRIVVIADDSGLVQRLLTLLREAPRWQSQVMPVERLADAGPLLTPERCDVVLLDLAQAAPVADGRSVLQQVQALSPALPLVVLTPEKEGDDEEVAALQALEQGAQELLSKSRLDGSGLVRALRYAMARHRAAARQRAGTIQGTQPSPAQELPAAEAEPARNPRDELLGIVVHDLRNPLSTVAMVASLMLATPAADEAGRRLQRHAEKLDRAARRMEQLLRDLQDLTSIESGSLSITTKPTSISSLLQEAIKAHASAAQAKGITLRSASLDSEDYVTCDRERILQVLAHIVGNAVKFTPAGGTIELRAIRRADAVDLAIADTGPGIAATDLSLLLERSWRSWRLRQGKSADRTGTGLGLAISKGILELHGVRLGAESELGKGATFSFALPRAPAGLR